MEKGVYKEGLLPFKVKLERGAGFVEKEKLLKEGKEEEEEEEEDEEERGGEGEEEVEESGDGLLEKLDFH